MNAAQIRELTDAELVKQLDDLRRELLHLRIQAKTGNLESSARVRQARREIARCLTEQGTRQRAQQASAGA